ncbi:MAG: DUF3768 domain-containing protein [Pseudolabrys sp.]
MHKKQPETLNARSGGDDGLTNRPYPHPQRRIPAKDIQANDPHHEHDFGSFDADGQTIFFKIDYYDRALMFHSPDPANPSVTQRIMTIMLAHEY